MYYILYLASLCKRRRWPDPHYECFPYNSGFACNVRVNHRDYTGDDVHATQELAREAAAQRAYLICRNISVSDSMYGQSGLPGTGSLPGTSMAGSGGTSMLHAGQIPSQQQLAAAQAMAQPRYVPPTGGIMQMNNNGVPRSDQGISLNGRMGSVSGGLVVGNLQMGL